MRYESEDPLKFARAVGRGLYKAVNSIWDKAKDTELMKSLGTPALSTHCTMGGKDVEYGGWVQVDEVGSVKRGDEGSGMLTFYSQVPSLYYFVTFEKPGGCRIGLCFYVAQHATPRQTEDGPERGDIFMSFRLGVCPVKRGRTFGKHPEWEEGLTLLKIKKTRDDVKPVAYANGDVFETDFDSGVFQDMLKLSFVLNYFDFKGAAPYYGMFCTVPGRFYPTEYYFSFGSGTKYMSYGKEAKGNDKNLETEEDFIKFADEHGLKVDKK
jgi:hypothetical protein